MLSLRHIRPSLLNFVRVHSSRLFYCTVFSLRIVKTLYSFGEDFAVDWKNLKHLILAGVYESVDVCACHTNTIETTTLAQLHGM